MGKEITSRFLNTASNYDAYLSQRGVNSFGRRAIGILTISGAEIVIDSGYYFSGGILPEQLAAIELHEKIELTSKSKDPHLEATIGEYKFIFNQSGEGGLRQYHANLCNLMGGDNSIRNKALSKVLGK